MNAKIDKSMCKLLVVINSSLSITLSRKNELSKECFSSLLIHDFKSDESAAANSRRINAAFG